MRIEAGIPGRRRVNHCEIRLFSHLKLSLQRRDRGNGQRLDVVVVALKAGQIHARVHLWLQPGFETEFGADAILLAGSAKTVNFSATINPDATSVANIRITKSAPQRLRPSHQIRETSLHIPFQPDAFQFLAKSFSMSAIADVDHFMA